MNLINSIVIVLKILIVFQVRRNNQILKNAKASVVIRKKKVIMTVYLKVYNLRNTLLLYKEILGKIRKFQKRQF